MTFQQVIVAGNLGADPELRYFNDGTAICNFSLATNRVYTNPQTQEQVKEVTWFRVSVKGKQGEAAHQYLKKGSGALCVGHLRQDKTTGGPRMWTGQDGTVRTNYELAAFTVRFLGGGAANGQAAPADDIPGFDSNVAAPPAVVAQPAPINVGVAVAPQQAAPVQQPAPIQQAAPAPVPGSQYTAPISDEEDEIPF